MVTLILMVVLVFVAGWLDAQLDWQHAAFQGPEGEQR
jgi:hypothetical protein